MPTRFVSSITEGLLRKVVMRLGGQATHVFRCLLFHWIAVGRSRRAKLWQIQHQLFVLVVLVSYLNLVTMVTINYFNHTWYNFSVIPIEMTVVKICDMFAAAFGQPRNSSLQCKVATIQSWWQRSSVALNFLSIWFHDVSCGWVFPCVTTYWMHLIVWLYV